MAPPKNTPETKAQKTARENAEDQQVPLLGAEALETIGHVEKLDDNDRKRR